MNPSPKDNTEKLLWQRIKKGPALTAMLRERHVKRPTSTMDAMRRIDEALDGRWELIPPFPILDPDTKSALQSAARDIRSPQSRPGSVKKKRGADLARKHSRLLQQLREAMVPVLDAPRSKYSTDYAYPEPVKIEEGAFTDEFCAALLKFSPVLEAEIKNRAASVEAFAMRIEYHASKLPPYVRPAEKEKRWARRCHVAMTGAGISRARATAAIADLGTLWRGKSWTPDKVYKLLARADKS